MGQFFEGSPVVYENSKDLLVPEQFIGGKQAIRCRFNPRLGDSTADVFRPIPGIFILIIESNSLSVDARNTLIAERARSLNGFYNCLIVDRGPVVLRFGNSVQEVPSGAGLLYRYGSNQEVRPFVHFPENGRFVQIMMTHRGILEASGRLGVPIPGVLKSMSGESRQASVVPLNRSASFVNFVSSIVDLPVADNHHNAFLRSKLGELLCYLSSLDATGHLGPDNDVPAFVLRRLEKAKTQLEHSLDMEMNLTALARGVGLSKTRLSHDFKLVYGKTFRSYRQELRLAKGLELLSETSLSIEQISQACGYKNVGNFSRAFKGRFGNPPTRYRRL